MLKSKYLTSVENLLKYQSLIENFKTNMEDIESSPNARRNFLIQLCTGKAKDAISGTVMLPSVGYAKAQSILREMFAHQVTKGGSIKEFGNE